MRAETGLQCACDPVAPHPDDVKNLTVGVKKTRALLASSAFSGYLADEVFPGEDCQSDEAIEAWLRDNAEHVYHLVGTCN